MSLRRSGTAARIKSSLPTIASYSPSGRSRAGAGGEMGDNASSPAWLALKPVSPSKCAGSMTRRRRPAQIGWRATSWRPCRSGCAPCRPRLSRAPSRRSAATAPSRHCHRSRPQRGVNRHRSPSCPDFAEIIDEQPLGPPRDARRRTLRYVRRAAAGWSGLMSSARSFAAGISSCITSSSGLSAAGENQ